MSGTDTVIAELNESTTEDEAATAPPRPAALPYLSVANARDAIGWYIDTFGASLVGEVYEMDDGRVGHAELQIGDTKFMLNDEFPERGNLGPKARGGSSTGFIIYLDNVDSAFRKAIDAGGTQTMAVEDQFWGDRMGTLTDPFGHSWSLATHIEDVPESELPSRMQQFFSKQKQAEPA